MEICVSQTRITTLKSSAKIPHNNTNQSFVIGANAFHRFVQFLSEEIDFALHDFADGQESLFGTAAELTFDGFFDVMAGQRFVFEENLAQLLVWTGN